MKTIKDIIFLTLITTSNHAYACECSHPQSLEEGDWSYAFKGEVMSVSRKEGNGRIEELVTFKVIKNITDVKSRTQRVLFRMGVDPCDVEAPNFKSGEIYTITSMGNIETNLLYNNYCNLRLKH